MTRLLMLAALAFPMSALAHGEHACENNQSEGYACSHVEFLGNLSLEDLGADGPADRLNDLWGWTDPASGREFLVVGMYRGTAFVEITDPTHPVFLGRLPSPPLPAPESVDGNFGALCHGCDEGESLWMDVKVFDHYAYIVSEQTNFGMRVFDLHRLLDVDTPQQFTADSEVDSFGDAHNIFINEDTGFAYVIGNNAPSLANPVNFGGLLVFDLNADPLNPEEVADYEELQFIHDVQCVVYAGPDAEYEGREICFASNSGGRRNTDSTSPYYGQTFYLDDNTDTYRSDWTFDSVNRVLVWPDNSTTAWPTPADEYAQLAVLDVTDKADIKVLGSAAQEKAAYIHQSWLFEDQQFLMVNDERESKRQGTRTSSYVFDVRDLDAVRVHADYLHPTMAIAHNEYVKGRFTYQANYGAGLRVLDISAPEAPVQVGYFDTQPGSDLDDFYGTWTAYPFFESGTIAMSDMNDGLVLARMALTESGELVPDVAVAAELLLVENADDVFYVAYANNGPAAATEVDFTFHLPLESTFSDRVPSEGMHCTVANRVVTCQLGEIPSCATGLVSLSLDTSEIGPEKEIIAMAAAREIEATGATADNLVRVKVSSGKTTVDTGALEFGVRAKGCALPPVIDAGENQSVQEGDKVTLAMVTDEPEQSIATTVWQQLEGPEVTLSEPNDSVATFTAPEVASITPLVFSVSVTNIHGLTADDKVEITVNPKPIIEPPPGGGAGGGGALLYLLALLPLCARRRC